MDATQVSGVLQRLAADGACHVDVGMSLGWTLWVEDEQRQQVLKCERRSSQGRACFDVFAGEQALFSLKATSLVNMGAGYDLHDSATGGLIGIVARQAAKSLLWDSWVIYGPDGAELARVNEDSVWKYLLRKFLLGPLLPMSHVIYSAGGMRVGGIRELVGWFTRRHRLALDSPDYCPLDFRLLIATTILLAVVQARAEDGSRRWNNPFSWLR